MPRIHRPKELPIAPEVGNKVGSGQDNAVYDLVEPASRPHLRRSIGQVLKINHPDTKISRDIRNRDADPKVAAWRGILYKKNKYEILKYFLGDFIPTSYFVFAQEGTLNQENFDLSNPHKPIDKRRHVEVIIQQKLPKCTMKDLTAEQKQDPRLRANVERLLSKMQIMYKILGETNARTGNNILLDAKLDLGGVSDLVRTESLDQDISQEAISNIINNNRSPNILIDPETMNIYCIDFDQGQWVDGMDEAKKLAFNLAEKSLDPESSRSLGRTVVESRIIA